MPRAACSPSPPCAPAQRDAAPAQRTAPQSEMAVRCGGLLRRRKQTNSLGGCAVARLARARHLRHRGWSTRIARSTPLSMWGLRRRCPLPASIAGKTSVHTVCPVPSRAKVVSLPMPVLCFPPLPLPFPLPTSPHPLSTGLIAPVLALGHALSALSLVTHTGSCSFEEQASMSCASGGAPTSTAR